MRSVACVDVHFGNGTRIDYSGLIGSYSSRQGEEAEIALVHNEGGVMSSHCTLILGRERR